MKIHHNNKTVSQHAIWLAEQFDKQLDYGDNPFRHYLDYAKKHNLVIVYGDSWDGVTISVAGQEWCDAIEFPIEKGGSFYINPKGELHTVPGGLNGALLPDPSTPSTEFKKITCKYISTNANLRWKISTDIPYVMWRQLNENRLHSHCIIFCLDDMV